MSRESETGSLPGPTCVPLKQSNLSGIIWFCFASLSSITRPNNTKHRFVKLLKFQSIRKCFFSSPFFCSVCLFIWQRVKRAMNGNGDEAFDGWTFWIVQLHMRIWIKWGNKLRERKMPLGVWQWNKGSTFPSTKIADAYFCYSVILWVKWLLFAAWCLLLFIHVHFRHGNQWKFSLIS